MSCADYEVRGDVAVIAMDNPPVNGLGHELRREIVEGLDRAVADAAVAAVILVGAGKVFSGGADIREFNSPKATAEPTLHTVIREIEGMGKPVIAAIAGACMGGGLELALACHFRVALADAQIALPEVKLGILPGAGGTQRLPRLVGLETALNMVVSGKVVPAAQLKATELFDSVFESELVGGALAFARRVIDEKRPLALVRHRTVDYPNHEGFLEFARNTVATVARNFPAPAKCIEALGAAVSKPFEEGLKVERECFLYLVGTPESKALRHAFFAERAASKIPDIPSGTQARPIARAAVIGAGTMGGGIAMCFASAGIPVTVLDTTREALDRGLGIVRREYENGAKKGRLTEAQAVERIERIGSTLAYEDIGRADIVIEAVFEDLEVKRQVFRELDSVMKPGAILATNTSTLDVNRIAGFTNRPQDVVGLHFFSPANVMKLLEIVRGAATANDVIVSAMTLARKLRKTGIVSGVCDGFIGNRMLGQYLRQAMFLLEEGATPRQVDRALEDWGMAMGPFRMSDLAGNDISWHIRKRRYLENPDVVVSKIADRVCELGRFGQKTGAGWYRYEKGRREAIPDPAIEQLIVEYRKQIGVDPRSITATEIVERCIYALVNEGARVLEEGIALRPSDIDMVYLTGYGFPLHRGGPMHYADGVGLYSVVRSMRRFAANPHGAPDFWTPAPLLAKLAREGGAFNA
jgi:3-hydroxyacyl-CoA dehydrogenase